MECKKTLGEIFRHRCAFIVLIFNQGLIVNLQTLIIVEQQCKTQYATFKKKNSLVLMD